MREWASNSDLLHCSSNVEMLRCCSTTWQIQLVLDLFQRQEFFLRNKWNNLCLDYEAFKIAKPVRLYFKDYERACKIATMKVPPQNLL